MKYLLIPELRYLSLQFFDLPTNTANIWQWIFAIPLGIILILTFVKKREKASFKAMKGICSVRLKEAFPQETEVVKKVMVKTWLQQKGEG